MPLTAKGKKIKANMIKEYGAEKGTRVFYASENSGRIKGVARAGSAHGSHSKPSHSRRTAKK